MCRNIKTLFNFEPPATDEEIRAASMQFVRKLSGFTRPSQKNQAAFDNSNSACIQCGICIDVCPMGVLSFQVGEAPLRRLPVVATEHLG